MIRVKVPNGSVIECREPTPVDIEVHGWGNEADIALACIRTVDGRPADPKDITVPEQQAVMVALESFLRPTVEQGMFMEQNWREASRRSALLALPSGMRDALGAPVTEPGVEVASCVRWIEIAHPSVSEMNDAMEVLERTPASERKRVYNMALLRLMYRCIRSVTENDVKRSVTVVDLTPWPWSTVDVSVAMLAFLTICQLTDGQKAAIRAGIEVVV